MSKNTMHLVQTKGLIRTDKNYKNLLQELKSIIAKGQLRAYKAVDNIKVQTYWQIGERIVREELKYKNRADYGKYLIDNLTVDLGIKRQRLYEFIQFYRAYPIVRALHGQLSWYHYLCLIKITDDKERSFYQNQAILNSWSYRKLQGQIKNNLYENTSQKEIEEIFKAKLPPVNKYIGYYRRNRQYEHEKDTIGLIICREAGKEEIV
ncbi:MAG: hypothetical protein DRH57_02720, partial [Candidatus Cloacimonadota bacterium]